MVLTLLEREIRKVAATSPTEKVLAIYITPHASSHQVLRQSVSSQSVKSTFQFTTAHGVRERLKEGSGKFGSYKAVVAVFDAVFASTNRDMMAACASMLLSVEKGKDEPEWKRFSFLALSDTGFPFFPAAVRLRKLGSDVTVTHHVLEHEHRPQVVFHDSSCSYTAVAKVIMAELLSTDPIEAPRLITMTAGAKCAGPMKHALQRHYAAQNSNLSLRTWIITADKLMERLTEMRDELDSEPNIKAVAWIEPDVRFMVELPHVHKHFAFASELKAVFDRRRAERVYDFIPTSQMEAQSLASIFHWGQGPAEITLLRRSDATPMPRFPSTASLAWLVEPMETLLLLAWVYEAGDDIPVVENYHSVTCHACLSEPDLVDEMLHRLTCRNLLSHMGGTKKKYTVHDLVSAVDLSKLSTSEALFLAEMQQLAAQDNKPTAALQILAACRSVILVDPDQNWTLQRVRRITESEARGACVGLFGKMSHKGPLWLAMGLIARAFENWDGTNNPNGFEAGHTKVVLQKTLLDKFKKTMTDTGKVVGISTEETDSWASAVLSDEDTRLVEKILVKCYIDHLFIAHDPEPSEVWGRGLVAGNAMPILRIDSATLDSNLRNNSLWCLVDNPPKAKGGPNAEFTASLLTCVSPAAVKDALHELGAKEGHMNMRSCVDYVRDRYLLQYMQ